MKVLLGVRIQPRNGWMCLDCAAQPGENDRIVCQNPVDVSDLLDNNEVMEMDITDILDYLPAPARNPAMINYLTKIAHNGTIVVSGLCPLEVTRLIHQGQITGYQPVNDVVYGNPVNRKSWCTASDTAGMVMQTGQFLCERIFYSGLQYHLVFRRK